jgi:hypothetical protein
MLGSVSSSALCFNYAPSQDDVEHTHVFKPMDVLFVLRVACTRQKRRHELPLVAI